MTACAASPPTIHAARVIEPEAPIAPPSADYMAALGRAHEARERAREKHGPSIAELEAADGEEAIDAILVTWAAARRDLTQEAQRAYADALHAARTPEEEAEVHAELAEMWLGVQEDIESALLAAAPAKYRNDPSLVSVVQIGTTVALRPLRDRVAVHVDTCERISRERAPSGTTARMCSASSERYEATLTLHPALAFPDASPAPTAPISPNENQIASAAFGLTSPVARAPLTSAIVTGEARPIVPTTRPKPCTFKGTLVTRGTIYAENSGTRALMPILGTPIEVESLDVPDQPGGRYKVSVTWPTPMTGWLETDDPPFVLRRQVELVPEAAWVESGERVAASEARGPTVRAKRTFDDPAGGASQRKPVPEGLDRRLFCHDLDLATAPTATHAGVSIDTKLRTDVAVPLLAAPNGKEVARIVAGDVHLVERRGPYAHVAGEAPFGFDGWVDAGYLRRTDGHEAM